MVSYPQDLIPMVFLYPFPLPMTQLLLLLTILGVGPISLALVPECGVVNLSPPINNQSFPPPPPLLLHYILEPPICLLSYPPTPSSHLTSPIIWLSPLSGGPGILSVGIGP